MRARVVLTRYKPGPEGDRDGLGGRVVTPSGLTLYSHELPYRDVDGDGNSDKNRSCVPPGVYLCEYLLSPAHKKKVYHLTKVLMPDGSWGPLPGGRTVIEIHVGNLTGDVELGALTPVLGCVVLGNSLGVFPAGQAFKCADGQVRKLPKPQHGVLGSVDALERFEADLGGETFELQIVQGEVVLQ